MAEQETDIPASDEEPGAERSAVDAPVDPPVEVVVEPAAEAAPDPDASAPQSVEHTVDTGAVASPNDPVPTAPFLAYGAAWLAFAVFVVWRLSSVPEGGPVYEADIYGLTTLLGITLTLAGPLVILTAWLNRRTSGGATAGAAFAAALTKGAWAMLFGVSVWWGSLMVVDYVRLGRIL